MEKGRRGRRGRRWGMGGESEKEVFGKGGCKCGGRGMVMFNGSKKYRTSHDMTGNRRRL